MADTEYLWEPLTVAGAAAVFAPLEIPWWIAGGEAVDLFVGRATRVHGDLDTSMLRRDVHHLRRLRDEWDIHIAHDGALTPWDGAPLADEVHQFWVRRMAAEAWAFEVLLEYTGGDDWLFRRDHRVRRAAGEIGRLTPDGVPFLAPEICLLYKAAHADWERNALDFEVAAPVLEPASREWLINALQVASSGHPWIERLAQVER